MNLSLNFKRFSEFKSVQDIKKLESDFNKLNSPETKLRLDWKVDASSSLALSEDKTQDISFKFAYPSKKKSYAEELVSEIFIESKGR